MADWPVVDPSGVELAEPAQDAGQPVPDCPGWSRIQQMQSESLSGYWPVCGNTEPHFPHRIGKAMMPEAVFAMSDKQRHDDEESQKARDDALAQRRLQALKDAREHIAGIASKPNERGYNDHKEPLEVRVREELRVARWLMGESRDGDF